MRLKKQGLENKYRWDSCLAHSNGKIRVKITYMKESRSLWEWIFVFVVLLFIFFYNLTAREAKGMRMLKVFE